MLKKKNYCINGTLVNLRGLEENFFERLLSPIFVKELNVIDCLHRSADGGQAPILLLLDLPTAFDIIDYSIPIKRPHFYWSI